MFGVLFFIAIFAGWLLWRNQQKTALAGTPLPEAPENILEAEVSFFRKLTPAEKNRFTTKATGFLQRTRIEAVGTTITDTDKLLVAASAIIPVFGFPEWSYSNLTDVLIYDDHFNETFSAQGSNRQYMGMVGSGYLNGKMLLSKTALREGFSNRTDKNNTAIHEFVHLLDKSDGAVDGIPENFLDKQFVIPWLDMMHQKMKDILADKSDINPYGATDKTEFFAVAAEYFFEQPQLLKTNHPQLYNMLERIFKQEL